MTVITINKNLKNNHIYINNTYIDLKLIPKHICVLEDILYFINNKLTIYNLNYNKQNDIYSLHNNKLLSKKTNIYNYIKNKNINTLFLTIIEKNKGGGGLSSIFNAVFQIWDFVMMLYKIVMWLIMLVWWLIQFIFWVVLDLLNPR